MKKGFKSHRMTVLQMCMESGLSTKAQTPTQKKGSEAIKKRQAFWAGWKKRQKAKSAGL